MKPDELWEKYAQYSSSGRMMRKPAFMDALTEYGELVKSEAVKVCREHPDGLNTMGGAFITCAAAIEKMELP